MKRILALVLSLALCFCLMASCSKTDPWQEQYDLGVKYLENGDYEQAIIAFEAAIEIDPKRPEPYLQLVDIYLALGDEAAALEWAARGAEATGDEALMEMVEELSACRHEWSPATFTQPETCLKCGETQGGPKPSAFSANDIALDPWPAGGELPAHYMCFDGDDRAYYTRWENGVISLTRTAQPAEEAGQKRITLTLLFDMPCAMVEGQTWTRVQSNLCDLYTGLQYQMEDTLGDEENWYEMEIPVDGRTYTVQYDQHVTWEYGEWEWTEEYGWVCAKRCEVVYDVLMPADYDGLVLALPEPSSPEDTSEDSDEDEEDGYIMDWDADVIESSVFIHIG